MIGVTRTGKESRKRVSGGWRLCRFSDGCILASGLRRRKRSCGQVTRLPNSWMHLMDGPVAGLYNVKAFLIVAAAMLKGWSEGSLATFISPQFLHLATHDRNNAADSQIAGPPKEFKGSKWKDYVHFDHMLWLRYLPAADCFKEEGGGRGGIRMKYCIMYQQTDVQFQLQHAVSRKCTVEK
jgi:hypothetical protein